MNSCKLCGQEVSPVNRAKYGMFCSAGCFERWSQYHKKPNCKCVICGKDMYIKLSRLQKTKHGVTCSRECGSKLRSIYSQGTDNHQYGLRGHLNASFIGDIIISNYGYILEYAPNHPFPHDSSNNTTRVLQHRLVVERNYTMFDPNAFTIINDTHYLKPEYAVHHINQNRQDNRIENLQVMLKGEHTRLHCLQKKILKDPTTGRIIGVVKLDKNGEPCDGNTVLTSQIANKAEKQCRA